MVRLTEMPAVGRGFILRLEMPVFEDTAWTTPVPAQERRVA